jgi:hypothetical protein
MTIRKVHQNDGQGVSGYLVYYRANGSLELYNPETGSATAVQTNIDPTIAPRRVRIEANNNYVRVFVDGVLFIDYINLSVGSLTPSTGYVDLITYGVTASYNDVDIFFRDAFPLGNHTGALESSAYTANWIFQPSGTSSPDITHYTGQLVLVPPYNWLNWATPQALTVTDFTADFAMRLDNTTGDNTLWGAFTFRKASVADDTFNSGYTVFYRSNGELDLLKAGTGIVATVTPGVAPTTYRNMRVWVIGNRIRVSVDGVPQIDWTDPGTPYTSGYVDLSSYGTVARFEFLEIY